MQLFLAFFLFSLALVNGQLSLQEDYNTVFSAAEDNQKNDPDGILKRSLEPPQSRFRLPNAVLPTHYNLKISPIIDEGQSLGARWTTPGEVVITVVCELAQSVIRLHSKNTTINEASTKVLHGVTELPLASQLFEPENSFFDITLQSPLQVGETYTIQLTFVSLISVELNGLYQSSYIDPDTQERVWLATTQMEALHARQMFPCFDEPWIKAEFDVVIGRRDIHLALFSTQSVGNTTMENVDGWMWETFATTVKMPTYLLAVIISTFTYSEAQGNALVDKTVRTYAPKHYIDANGGTYAAELADQMLAFLEVYYNQVYPLEKMDSVAVPDFFFGAMENWGLNIYRETALLYFEGESNEAERYTVTRILGHELAHQWFGNLVTCAWWTHIWLNEGFATYISAQTVAEFHPEYDVWERFQNDVFQAAMLFDARPEVSHSVKIDEEAWPLKDSMSWFDRIAYEKGGSLIRMMRSFLTEETLKKGLRRYLDVKKYQGAEQDDLFESLNVDALADNRLPNGLTVKEIMDTWTLQPHFPLVRVFQGGNNRILISQEIFVNNQGQKADSSKQLDPNHMWYVPVSIATRGNPSFDPNPEFWILKNVALTSYAVDSTQWIVANAGATGYYRVLYDSALTNLLRQQLEDNHEVIASSVTRSQILDDYFHSAFQKYISIETALELTSYLGNETKIVVWNAALTHLRKALNLFVDDSLRTYLLPKINSALELTGGVSAVPANGTDTLRHVQFLDWNCALQGPECETFAKSLYEQWKLTPAATPVRLDIRPIVYCAIVATGEEEEFNFVKARYVENTIAKQKGFLLNSLGCSESVPVIDGILENILVDTYEIPKEVRGTLLQRLAMNALARPKVVQFFRNQAVEINEYFGNANVMVNAVLAMRTYMATTFELETIQSLKTAHELIFEDRLESSIQEIDENIQWMSDFGNKMGAFFKP